MTSAIKTKFAVMMFLEYVIYGAWLPLLGLYIGNKYLNFTPDQQGWVFNAFAIASITGMFFGGQLVDRYFAQERFLAFSHLIGGLAMIGLAYQTTYWPFFGLMLLHCFFFVPTMSVTNAIVFANIKDPQKEFGTIRVWGTIGWIAVAWPFVFIPIDWANVPSMAQAGGFVSWLGTALATPKTGGAMQEALTSTFLVSGVASLVLAAFSLTLPHTPPAPAGGEAFAPWEAFKLLKVPSILVLFVVTFLDSLVHYCYFFWTSRYYPMIGLPENWITPAMSIGQIAEIATMAWLGSVLKRLGWRTTMILGILGHVVRFGIYAIGTKDLLWLVILSNVVHGFAYAFFFATVYIYVDENFPKDVRTSAQSLFNLLILGLGPLSSNFLSAWLVDLFLPKAGAPDAAAELAAYHQVFLVPLGLGILAALILAIFFHPEPKPAVPEAEPALAG
ncbi:MAG TPA: MFS transporter [Isosphaeraceae bacterium]|nr:MFS transporter [Isosphaeraceae bacterium]